MHTEPTFVETIDRILGKVRDQDPNAVRGLRDAMILGAMLAERRMSLSPASAAALRRELEALSIDIAFRRAPKA